MKRTKRFNRKGIILTPGIVFMFFVIMLAAFSAFSIKNKNISEERKIGELEFEMIDAMQQPEKTLLYIDSSAKYSGVKAAYTLAYQGGYYEIPTNDKPISLTKECGKLSDGTRLWIDKDNKDGCFPDYRNSYKSYFDSYFSLYMMSYNQGTNEYKMEMTRLGNYDYFVKSEDGRTKILGFAAKDIAYDFKGFLYSIKPSFSTTVDYDLDEYKMLKDKVTTVSYLCFNKSDSNLSNCVVGEFLEPYKVEFVGNRTFKVEFTSSKLLLERLPITYRFAFYIGTNESSLPYFEPYQIESTVTETSIAVLSEVYSKKYEDIDPKLIKAMIMQESSGNVNAIRCEDSYEGRWKELVNKLGCSRYGCDQTFVEGKWKGYHKVSCSYGLMQIMYPTALESCKNSITTPESLMDPILNMDCGTSYLKKMIAECGSIKKGVYGYNHGPAQCKTADVDNDVYVASVSNNCKTTGCSLTEVVA